MSTAQVAWISIAPVKGLSLNQAREIELRSFGVAENRRFYLVDDEGRMVSGVRLGRLVQVAADYDEEEGLLSLGFPDGDTVSGTVDVGDRVTTSFYGRPVEGSLVAGPWGGALSDWAGQPVRLVRSDESGAGADRGPGGGITIVSNASLDALARAAGSDERVDGRRFRMLFGLDGLDAHEEDGWLDRRVRVGEAVVVPRGNVGRCAVTTQNPETGVPDFDTLRLLKAYRGDVQTTEPLPFGVWGEVAEPGRVRVGDAVEAE